MYSFKNDCLEFGQQNLLAKAAILSECCPSHVFWPYQFPDDPFQHNIKQQNRQPVSLSQPNSDRKALRCCSSTAHLSIGSSQCQLDHSDQFWWASIPYCAVLDAVISLLEVDEENVKVHVEFSAFLDDLLKSELMIGGRSILPESSLIFIFLAPFFCR